MNGAWIDLLLVVLLVGALAVLFLYFRSGHGQDEDDWSGRLTWRNYFPTLARQAGFDPGSVWLVYWAAKVALAALLPVFLLRALGLGAEGGSGTWVVVVAVLGFVVPDLYLLVRRSARIKRIQAGLSYFLDLLVSFLRAGLNVEEAFRRAGRTGFRIDHPLAQEVAIVAREIDVGKDRTEAFRALAQRTGARELRAVASALQMGSRLGTSVEATLSGQADLMRTRHRERIQRKVNASPVKALFPVILCGLPVFAVLVFYPAFLEIFDTFDGLKALFR
jgi:tight adherence protein C